ncbi:MAG: SDR family NAD(P)-dependent oxidoreductase, partial [Xanthomonadales bacterium]|nr:SDR family NAD(P)-dependent oxidoreductase [Xanthomonadales bacterium]
MNLPLAGRHALITGSSRGVGRAAARVFAQQGARVVLHANQGNAAAAAVAAELGDAALGVLTVDLSVPGAGSQLFAQA